MTTNAEVLRRVTENALRRRPYNLCEKVCAHAKRQALKGHATFRMAVGSPYSDEDVIMASEMLRQKGFSVETTLPSEGRYGTSGVLRVRW